MTEHPEPRVAAEWEQLASLVPFVGNPRRHERAVPIVAASIRRFGWGAPIVARRAGRVIIAGHTRREAALLLVEQWAKATSRERAVWHPEAVRTVTAGEVPVRWKDLDEHDAALLLVADNRIGEEYSETDDAELAQLLQRLGSEGVDLIEGTGLDDAAIKELLGEDPAPGDGSTGGAGPDPAAAASLAERFLEPPFTVLDARTGRWQDRKRAWIALGIASEIGRGENLLDFSPSASIVTATSRAAAGRLTFVQGDRPREELDETSAKILDTGSGTSIFDPVLCELAYRWFCPPGGAVLDPFAGGSVRGIVAGWLGRAYTGVDLRPEQVAANEEQGRRLFAAQREGLVRPRWIAGDSREIDQLAPGAYDLVFSCPPYADLEKYSDDPRDLSTMEYSAFAEAYREIIRRACAQLRPDRFAVFVVGDVRDPRSGVYRGFVGDTIEAFEAAGLQLYNEAVLVTAIGSLALRAGRQFTSARKLGKAHQNVVVMVKGDWKRATEACGPVDVAMPEEATPAPSGPLPGEVRGRYGEELP